MANILVVGAGRFQAKGIIEVKEKGHYVIAVDGDPFAVGKKYSDEFHHVDIKEKLKILELARQKKVNAVISIASELSIETVSFISERLELVGIPYETAVLSHNKKKYYNLFEKNGIIVPETCSLENFNINNISTDYIIIKPSKGSGSRGVEKINRRLIADYNFDYYSSRILREDEEVLFQEYICGKEMTVDGMVVNGIFYLLAISQEVNCPEISDTVSRELVFPPTWITEQISMKIRSICQKIATLLELDFSPMHFEYKINDNGDIYLIDFSLRGGGFDLFTEIVEMTSGINVVSEYINGSLSENVNIYQPKIFNPVILRFLYAEKKGILKEVVGLERIQEIKNCIFGVLKNINDEIYRPKDGTTRLAYLITWGETHNIALNSADSIEESVFFRIE